jgi:DNA-binding winged helix-turn-helix (wHTH) protein/thioredoxin-like negative regulator of GroEL
MGLSGVTRYKFGPYTLDPAERRISDEGNCRIELTAKAFDLLVFLVSRAGKLVTKDEILDEVWQGDSIAESNITTTISMIRKALKEDSERQYIETIPKKGYRFVANVCPEADTTPAVKETAPVPDPQQRTLRSRFLFIGFAALLLVVGIAGRAWHSRHLAAIAPDTPYGRAVRLEAEGNDEGALDTLNEVLRADPTSNEARVRAAWLSYQADDDTGALLYLSFPASAGSPGEPNKGSGGTLLKADGLRALLAGNADEAVRKFALASADDPKDVDALIYIAEVATTNGNLDMANNYLDQCLHLDKQNTLCSYERAEARVYEGRFDDAIAEFEKLGSKYPWLDEPAGRAELAKGNVPAALAHFNALAKNRLRFPSPSHSRASQDGIAAVDIYQGKIREGLMELKTSMESSASPYEKSDYCQLIAKISALHGDKREAKADSQSASRLSQSNEFVIPLARTFAISGDYIAAQNVLQQHRDIASQFGEKFGAAEQFVDGMGSLEKHDLANAIAQLESSNRKDPNPETTYFLAQAQMRQGDWQSAIQSLNRVLENRGTVVEDSVASLVPLAEYNLSICYGKLGQNTESDKHFLAASTMWANADSDVKATLTRLSTPATASLRHRQ